MHTGTCPACALVVFAHVVVAKNVGRAVGRFVVAAAGLVAIANLALVVGSFVGCVLVAGLRPPRFPDLFTSSCERALVRFPL